MWFERFLKRIDESSIGSAVSDRMDLIHKTDPQNIYVENIRSFFGVNVKIARFFCALAVREGLFEKSVGYICPIENNIIGKYKVGETVPGKVHCRMCEFGGEEEFLHDLGDLEMIDVYSVVSHGSVLAGDSYEPG